MSVPRECDKYWCLYSVLRRCRNVRLGMRFDRWSETSVPSRPIPDSLGRLSSGCSPQVPIQHELPVNEEVFNRRSPPTSSDGNNGEYMPPSASAFIFLVPFYTIGTSTGQCKQADISRVSANLSLAGHVGLSESFDLSGALKLLSVDQEFKQVLMETLKLLSYSKASVSSSALDDGESVLEGGGEVTASVL